ncbi:MAG: TonB-dependent receptor [Ignavibacteria bacterium]|nr:TonB-dependent receptor [Ignavibacteria bacterium]
MLNKFFGEYKFVFLNRHIFVAVLLIFSVKTSFSSDLPIYVYGKILSAETSEPIANAVIEIIGEKIFVTSKNDGSFSIGPISNTKFRIKITHVAYQEKLIDLELNNEEDRKLVIYLFPKTLNLNPVIITDKKSTNTIDDIQEYNLKLSNRALHQKLGQTIAHTLKNETGIAIRSMGPAPSRPIFRGLGQDRILITEDGMKTVDLSATSPDHAVTIDPFNSERIEVLRGPKILTQSSTTIGGIINVVEENIPEEIHNVIHLSAGSYFETVNNGWLTSLKVGIPIKPFQLQFNLSKRKTDDVKIPARKLINTSSENFISSVGLSFIKDFGFIGSTFRSYSLDYGIPGGFVGAHPFGVNIKISKQQIGASSKIKIDENNFWKFDFRYDYYRHKEFEHSGLIGSEFRIVTNSGKIIYEHGEGKIFQSGEVGISFEHRDFEIGGYVFTPPSYSFNISSFIYEDFHFDKLNIDAGLRFSYDLINPKVKKMSPRIGVIDKREFFNLSASISLIYQLSDVVFIGSNFSRSSRVPTIEELFSEGPHLAAYSYEVGNPQLNSEKGWGSEFFIYHKFENLDFNLNVFYNHLNSYIIPRNTGRINYQTFLPIYSTQGVNARIFGFEGSVKIKLVDKVYFQSSLSRSVGEFLNSSKPLPQIPPLKGLNQIYYSNEKLNFGISNEWSSAQRRVDEFEEPTAGYGIINLFGQSIFTINKFVTVFSMNVDNLFNKEYRNHLSRIKSVYPEPGRNFRFTLKVMF